MSAEYTDFGRECRERFALDRSYDQQTTSGARMDAAARIDYK
jgi:hypothetical protein